MDTVLSYLHHTMTHFFNLAANNIKHTYTMTGAKNGGTRLLTITSLAKTPTKFNITYQPAMSHVYSQNINQQVNKFHLCILFSMLFVHWISDTVLKRVPA